jgi:hypothetical protein
LRMLRSSANGAPPELDLNFAIFLKSLAACERQGVVICHRSARKAAAKKIIAAATRLNNHRFSRYRLE